MANANLLTYYDPFDGDIISYDGKVFGTTKNNKSFIGSRVSYNDVILHSFKTSPSISDEELKTTVEIKMYEDAGLDLEKKYKIDYIKKELDFEESILVEAFAIEIDKITELMEGVLRKTKHIDFLALSFLSFKTLYTNKIIEPKNDLFIYLEEDEAFLSIYKDGHYLSTKSLMTLNDIIKKLDDSGVSMSIDELREHLSTKGLDVSSYERGETTLYNELEAQFSSILTKINDIVVYNRSVFGFEKVDRVFLSTKTGRIRGIREFIANFGFLDIEIHDFNLFKEKQEKNFLENIVVSYIDDKLQAQDFSHNFTIFLREPVFYSKESGKIIIAASTLIILALAYVGMVYYENVALQKQNTLLQSQYNIMQQNQTKYKSKITAVNKELQEVVDKKEAQKKKLDNIALSMTQIENLKNEKHNSSSFIFDVNRLLRKHALATTQIILDGKNSMSIDIVAQYSKRDSITKFMEDLIANGFVGIKTDEIKSDKDIYLSTIEVKK